MHNNTARVCVLMITKSSFGHRCPSNASWHVRASVQVHGRSMHALSLPACAQPFSRDPRAMRLLDKAASSLWHDLADTMHPARNAATLSRAHLLGLMRSAPALPATLTSIQALVSPSLPAGCKACFLAF